jgi:hypothetical protein
MHINGFYANRYRQAGCSAEDLVEATQERTATGHADALPYDVGRELRLHLLQRLHQDVDDL